MKIKEALSKLNDFCNANRIEYMVTGTTALAMLGVPSNPQDIDIIDKPRAKHHLIGVQLVVLALKDKMKLRRNKDKTYMLNLIANLTSL